MESKKLFPVEDDEKAICYNFIAYQIPHIFSLVPLKKKKKKHWGGCLTMLMALPLGPVVLNDSSHFF